MQKKVSGAEMGIISRVVQYILSFMLIIGIIFYVTFPFYLRTTLYFVSFVIEDGLGMGAVENYMLPAILFIYICGGTLIWMCIELWFLFRRVAEGDPFVSTNSKSLMHMSIGSLAVMVEMIIFTVYSFSMAKVFCIGVFFVATLCCFVFSRLFQQAVEFKAENDLTV